MGFSYDKLWKKLIDNKMNKTDLQKCVGITSRTIAKMGKDENVNMDTLGPMLWKRWISSSSRIEKPNIG